jgi:hypothetical protein
MSERHAANEAFAVAFGNIEANGGADEGRMDVGLSFCVASFAEDDDREKDEDEVGQDWLIVDCVASQAIVFLFACAFLTWFFDSFNFSFMWWQVDCHWYSSSHRRCGRCKFSLWNAGRSEVEVVLRIIPALDNQQMGSALIVRKFDAEMWQVGSDDGGSSGDGIPRNNRNHNEV